MNSTASPNPNATTTPIAESRSRARCPKMPNSTAATRLPASAPAPRFNPVSNAKAAPVNDNSADPCTANDICRITINGPISPAINASKTAAITACWTNPRRRRSAVTSNANMLCSSCVRLSLMTETPVAHHYVLPAHPQDINLGAVEHRQVLRRHHLVDCAHPEPAVDQVQHSIDERQNGVDLVRDEQHRGVGITSPLVDQLRNMLCASRIQVQQGLVTQEYDGVAGQ